MTKSARKLRRREKREQRRCPGPGCRNAVAPMLLACRDHWAQIPPALRRVIREDFEAAKKGPGPARLRWLDAVAMAKGLMYAVTTVQGEVLIDTPPEGGT